MRPLKGGFALDDNLNGETANVVTSYNGFNETSTRLQNCVLQNSSGYGWIKAPLSPDFQWEDPVWNNTFTNNADGDFLKLN